METVEVVIKIPKERYEYAKKIVQKDEFVLGEIYHIIANGVVLPKGHGRLVDADAILEDPYGITYKDIDVAETIIEADTESEE